MSIGQVDKGNPCTGGWSKYYTPLGLEYVVKRRQVVSSRFWNAREAWSVAQLVVESRI
jgi:hypothetical protein